MSEKFQAIRGMKDLLQDDHAAFNAIVNKAIYVSKLYGLEQISTPILEYTNVFAKSLGISSDVVSKEMYSFLDKSNDSVTMRPEFTAGIMRAFISNGLYHKLPLRLFSVGPCFRYDRPQAGRQRQFHQINCEFLGLDSPYADAEMLCLARDWCSAWGILDDVSIEVNSLGCAESRSRYQNALIEYLGSYANELSEDSKKRLVKNPLRILDSKDQNDQKILTSAPMISDYYTIDARKYFEEFLGFLEVMNISYAVNQKLVRGLDYYCHIAFEITTNKLGAQSSIIGGGRYDGLSRLMGGPDIASCGFAAGVERIALMRDFAIEKTRPCVVMQIGDENLEYAARIVQILRSNGVKTIFENKGKIAKRMQNADLLNAKYVVFIGSDETLSAKLKVKDMDLRTEDIQDIEQFLMSTKNNI